MSQPESHTPRITIFALRGAADGATLHAIEQLRPHAGRLVVTGAGLSEASIRDRLRAIADDVVDAAGLRPALDLTDTDELVLADDSWFGPFGPFDDVLARAAEHPDRSWTLGPLDDPLMVGVRRADLVSAAWSRLWAEPNGTADDHSLARLAASLPATPLYPDGTAPALPRRALSADPLELDRHASAARWKLEEAAAAGYPVDLIWSSLARTVPPRVLNANGGMLEILPADDLVYDPSRPLSIAVIAHIYYEDMAGELLDRLAFLPTPYALVVTTTDGSKAEAIRATISARRDPHLLRFEVRVLESNRGRDQSAFYVGCRDILLDEQFDLVVKVHSKRSPQNVVAGSFFRRQQLDNLFATPEHASSLLALLQAERGLGIVFPPMIHTGYPTMGQAWFANREPFALALRRLGIDPPIDDASPLAPYGGMFVARREAIAAIAQERWDWSEYPDGDEYADGTLAHVQERLPVYAAAARGFHARTVATRAYAAMSHTMLEYKLDRMAADVEGYAITQVHSVQSRMSAEDERLTDIGRAVDGSRRDAIVFAMKKLFRR